MAIRQSVLLLLVTAVMLALAGCGGGSSANVQNPPPPASSNLTVAFQPPPPTSIKAGTAINISAVVTNDPSNSGVDWSLSCANAGSCGTIAPLHAASGGSVTYTPPSSFTGNSETVNIVAFATADHTKNVAAPLSITGFAASLSGTYVMQTSGADAVGPYQFAAVVVLANGVVTSGEQTINTFDLNTGVLTTFSDVINGGSYVLGPDGRGTLSLTTANQSIGQMGVEFFSLAYVSASQLLIAKIDDVNIQVTSFEASQGTMDLQTSTATPSGGYAFVVNGTDIASFAPTAFGGVINIDSPNTISGAGSVADENLAGGLFPNAALSGTVSAPDALGVVTFDLTTDFASSLQLTGYIVDSTHIKLIESDNSSGAGFASTSGVAISQGTAAGSFKTNSAFSGTYVFGILGQDFSFFPTSLASVGTFTADGLGNFNNGFNDEFFGGLFVQISDQFTGTYTVDSSGTGRVDSFLNYTNSGPGPEFIFYLTGNGNPPLVLDVDFDGLGGGGIAAGIAYPSTVPTSFSGPFALSFAQTFFGVEGDASGTVVVDGTTNTLSGNVDTSSFFTPVIGVPLTGTFTPLSNSNQTGGTLSEAFFPFNPISVELYFIESTHGFFMENDSSLAGTLTFGYFAASTPVGGAAHKTRSR